MQNDLIRNNLLTRKGYSPYCGDDHCCRSTPRTKFNGSQFECPCGWVSEFPVDFIQQYRRRWKLDQDNSAQAGLFDKPSPVPRYDLKKTRERVSYILDKFPHTRNCDLHLISKYMKEFHAINRLDEWAARATEVKVSFESIRRVRQKLNEQGLYLPTDPEILEQRGRLTKNFEDFSRE